MAGNIQIQVNGEARGWRSMRLAASLLLLGLGFASGLAWRDMGTGPSLQLAGAADDPAARLYEASLTKLLEQQHVKSELFPLPVIDGAPAAGKKQGKKKA